MGCLNFGCSYSAAHGVADEGGDTVLAYQNDISYVLDVWDVPFADIVKIYQQNGWQNVSELVFLKGMGEVYAGTVALKEGAFILFPQYASASPFLPDQYEDWFVGGLDDMALWTSYCWPYFLSWMTNSGPPSVNSDICLVLRTTMANAGFNFTYIDAADDGDDHDDDAEMMMVHKNGRSNFPAPLRKQQQAIMKHVKLERHQKATKLSTSGIRHPANNAGAAKPQPPARDVPLKTPLAPSAQTLTLYSNSNYSYLGFKVLAADLNKDGLSDVIVSAPGYSNVGAGLPQIGCVYVVLGTSAAQASRVVDVESVATYKICGKAAHSRFGHSVAVLDFNLDGVLDVVVGSPRALSEHMWYQGKAEVFFGHTVSTWRPSLTADVAILGDGWYSNFATSMTVGDANGDGAADLIVGSPFASSNYEDQQGFVAIFYSSKGQMSGSALGAGQADLFIHAPNGGSLGVSQYGWWGHSLLYIPASYTHTAPWLLVGGPGNVLVSLGTTVSEAGSVSVYQLDNPHRQKAPLAVFTGLPYDRLGARMSLGMMPDFDKTAPVLSFSLPAKNSSIEQTGEVIVIPLSKFMRTVQLIQPNIYSSIRTLYTIVSVTIIGNQEFGRFGSSVEFFPFVQTPGQSPTPTLFIGYPLWSFNTSEEGCVCAWTSGSLRDGSVITDPTASASRLYTSNKITGTLLGKDERYGSNLAFGDFDGDGASDIFIASERRSVHAILGGAIDLVLSKSR